MGKYKILCRRYGAKRNRVKTKERGSINTNTNWVILIHTIPLFLNKKL